MKTVIKNVLVDANDFVTFKNRNGELKAFHIKEISASSHPIQVDTKAFHGYVSIHNGEYNELYPIEIHENIIGAIDSVDIVEVVYDEEQEKNFLH